MKRYHAHISRRDLLLMACGAKSAEVRALSPAGLSSRIKYVMDTEVSAAPDYPDDVEYVLTLSRRDS